MPASDHEQGFGTTAAVVGRRVSERERELRQKQQIIPAAAVSVERAVDQGNRGTQQQLIIRAVCCKARAVAAGEARGASSSGSSKKQGSKAGETHVREAAKERERESEGPRARDAYRSPGSGQSE